MISSKTNFLIPLVLTFAGTLGGCASLGKCDPASCADDAKITADLQSKLNQMPDFGPPDSIRVQTVDSVVYLNGQVVGGLEKRLAESVASREPGVTRVVDSISVEHN
jgi:osmotically-inducible protein OsmY